MRLTLISTMLVLFALNSYSQETNSQLSLSQQDYLEKSKKQKKIGKILLVGGAALITTAIIIPKGDLTSDGNCIVVYCDDKYKNDGIKTVFFIAGGIAALGSIPLFMMSGKNRKRAASVSFKKENTVHLYNHDIVHTWIPALRVRVHF